MKYPLFVIFVKFKICSWMCSRCKIISFHPLQGTLELFNCDIPASNVIERMCNLLPELMFGGHVRK